MSEAGIDMLLDSAYGGNHVRRRLWTVDGHDGAENPIVNLGVEDGKAQAVWSQQVEVATGDASHEAVEAESGEV